MDIYIKDLYELWWQAQANESNPEYQDIVDFVNSYDIAFPLAVCYTFEDIEKNGLTQKGINEIMKVWKIAVEEGFIQV